MADPFGAPREAAGGTAQRVLVLGDVINDVLVRPLEAVTPSSDTRAQIVQAPGGSAANLACWLGSLGTDVTFVGRVGHEDAAFHSDFLRGFGVAPHLVVDHETQTGSIVIVVDDEGRRTMFTDRGANLSLRSDDVDHDLLAGMGHVHLTGYSFFEPGVREAALDLFARTREIGTPVSVDPSSSAFLRDVGPAQFLAWTKGASMIFPNRDEAEVLAGTSDQMLAASMLGEHYRTVITTLDSEGCIVVHDGSAPILVPADRVPAVDTTGAGDAFCAGFLARWVQGSDGPGAARTCEDVIDAARAGGTVAREVVTRMGGRPVRSI